MNHPLCYIGSVKKAGENSRFSITPESSSQKISNDRDIANFGFTKERALKITSIIVIFKIKSQ